jgi:excisionase family DNA binding protein
MMTIPEAAIYLGSTNSFVERAGRTGELPSRKVGQRRVFDVQDLDEWIDAQPFAPPVQRTKQFCD